MAERETLVRALLLQVEAGIDEALLDTPVNRLQAQSPHAVPPAPMRSALPPTASMRPAAEPRLMTASASLGEARATAAAAATIAELRAALDAFDRCSLRET